MSDAGNTRRPELPWAMWAGIAGALAASALSVKGILGSASSTAAIGFIFVPFVAIAAGVLAGVWGLALGTVVAHARGVKRALRPVLIMAWVATLAVPGAIAWEAEKGLALQSSVRALRGMDARHLEAAFDESRFRRDRFFLGALAQHPAASGDLLERIAALPDEALYEPMGSVWDVMGENRKGLAVMRMVARNPNARADTLARLAAAPRNDYVLSDVLANPRTPMPALLPHLESTNALLEWGLAVNPAAPPAVLERLSRSADRYTRHRVALNPSAPAGVLERLAKDSESFVARDAAYTLERRAKAGERK